MTKLQHVLDDWTRTDVAEHESSNRSILAKHATLAGDARELRGLPRSSGYVAYRWTSLASMPLYDRYGEIAPSDDEPPAMKRSRNPGAPVPVEDWPEVVAATGYTPPASDWKLYVFVPIY